jgi:hypothetical protein
MFVFPEDRVGGVPWPSRRPRFITRLAYALIEHFPDVAIIYVSAIVCCGLIVYAGWHGYFWSACLFAGAFGLEFLSCLMVAYARERLKRDHLI